MRKYYGFIQKSVKDMFINEIKPVGALEWFEYEFTSKEDAERWAESMSAGGWKCVRTLPVSVMYCVVGFSYLKEERVTVERKLKPSEIVTELSDFVFNKRHVNAPSHLRLMLANWLLDNNIRLVKGA